MAAPPSGGDSYGSPVAPPVGPPPRAAPPTYGSSSNNCDVIRSLTRTGNNCQQGGQECKSQCTTTQEQECTTEYEQICREVNEQVSLDRFCNVCWVMELLAEVFKISEMFALKSAYSREIFIFCEQK